MGEDGSFSFSAVKNGAQSRTPADASISYGGHHTNVTLNLSAGEIGDNTIVTAVILTADGVKYALPHVKHVWKKTELGWNWTDLDGAGLSGKTITNLIYYIRDGESCNVYSYDLNVPVKKNAGEEVSAAFTGDKEITLSGLPEDMENASATVKTKVGSGETPVVIAENVPVTEGKVMTSDVPVFGTTYEISVISDNYADVKISAVPEFSGYVLMNVPYGKFYEAEGISGVDAVTTATVKTYNQNMAAGSYHAGYEAADPISDAKILGVTYPVYVADYSMLDAYERVLSDDTATITVATGKSTVGTKEVTGADLLFASGDYAYSVLYEAPERYLEMIGSDTFGGVNGRVRTVKGAEGAVTMNASHADIEIKTTGMDVAENVTGIILTTADGDSYALRHVKNVWRKTEIGWDYTDLDGNGLIGKTITNLRVYTPAQVTDYRVSIYIPEYVKMNIPYSSFYQNVVGLEDGSGIDAFTSATTKKPAYFWDSSYKGNAEVAYGEGQTIKGVQLPVKLDAASLKNLKKITAAAEADDYYYYDFLEEAPEVYATALIDENGTVTPGRLNTEPVVLEGAKISVDQTTKHGDYMLTVTGDGGVLSEADKTAFEVFGVVMNTMEGKSYALRHLANMYYKDFHEVAFSTVSETTEKGQYGETDYFADLEGKTITALTFYTNAGTYVVNDEAKIERIEYVLMNIPYGKFYEAELGAEDQAVDAVSSSTFNKPRTEGLAGGSYHVNADGSDISGVIYPVKISDPHVLRGLTQVTDESSVDITVTNRGQTTTTTYSGKDALFESADYSWYVLDGEPAYYKVVSTTGQEDDPFRFGNVQGKKKTVQGVSGNVTVGARHADVEVSLKGTTGIDGSTKVSGVVLTTAEGYKYGLRHVANLWRGTEIGWNFGEMDLMGEEIVNIRYITQDAVIDYPVDIEISNAGYVLMNIPYGKFYEAELGADDQAVDAVASATKNKPRTGTLAGGSYHVNADGSDISGVIYPVFVEDMGSLDSALQVTDDANVTITVTNRGNETTTEYKGKDALFESADYSWYALSEKPACYKALTVAGSDEDKTYSFGAVSGRASSVQGVSGTVKTGARHADIEVSLSGTEGIAQGDTVSAVIVTDAAGKKYGLRHIANLWRATEIGWNEEELLTGENIITNIRYITQNAVIDYPVSIQISAAAGKVEKMMDALNESAAAEDEAAVTAAQEAYDALTDEQKSLVSDDAKAKLASAQASVAAARKAAAEKAAAEKAAAEKAAAEKAAAEKAAAEKAADVKITFKNKTVQKKLKKSGTATKTITIRKGKKLSLKAVASNGAKVTYKSGNRKVATVSKNGVIKAKKKGSVTIRVMAGGKTVKVKIKVR